jgi:hypothetical protein
MYDHTRRILTRALEFIEDYKNNLISPNEIMGLVGGSLSVLEEELPEEIHRSWNTCDCELEMLIVMQPELKQNEEVLECLNHFEMLVRNLLAENEPEESDWDFPTTMENLQVQAKPSLTQKPLVGAIGKSTIKPAGSSTPNKNTTTPKKRFGVQDRNFPLMKAQAFPQFIGISILVIFNIIDDSYQITVNNPYISDLVLGISLIIMSLSFLIMLIEKEIAYKGIRGVNAVLVGFFGFICLLYMGIAMIIDYLKGIALLK